MHIEKKPYFNILRNNSWYIFFALVPILIYSPFALDPVLHIRYISLALYESLGIFLLVGNFKKQLHLPRWALFYFTGWALYLFFSLIGLIVSGDKSGDGTFLWLQIILVGALPLILSQIFINNNSFTDVVLKLLLLTGTFALAIGGYQLYNIIISEHLNHTNIYEITSVFAHKNIFSEILLLILPCSVIAFINLKEFWKYFGLILAICCLLMIIVLMSKAVWVALIIGLFLTLLIFLVFNLIRPVRIKLSFTKKHLYHLIVFLLVSLTGLVIITRLGINKPLTSQMRDMTNIHAYANNDRTELWKKTIQLSENHIFSGIGLGNWKIDIMREGNKNLVSKDNLTFFQRPHNDYLWIFSEQGLPSLIIYLLTLFIIITMCYRLALLSVRFKDRLLYLLLNFAIVSYLVCSCFSFPKERIEHSIFLGFLFAIIIIDYDRSIEKKSLGFSKFLLLPLLFFICFSLFVGISRYNSELHLKRAYEARMVQDWQKESTEIGYSYSRFFKMDFVSTPLSWYKGEAFFNLHHIDEALVNFKEAEHVNPYHMHVLNNIATCYELKGNHELAIKYYKAAIDYSFYFEDAFFNLCAVYYNLGDYENAIATLQKIKPDTKDIRYSKFAQAVVEKYLKKLIETTDDKIIVKYLTKIEYNPNWYYQIFIKSVVQKKDFNDQLMLDIIYSIETIDKDAVTAKKIKDKKPGKLI